MKKLREQQPEEVIGRALTPLNTGVMAERLVQLGEISAGRQAFWKSGNTQSFDRSRPETASPREPIPEAFLTVRPGIPFELDVDRFMSNIRVARRGAAPGPSGLTAEHLLLVFESDAAVGALFQVADLLAKGFIPPEARSNPVGTHHSSREAHR